MELACTTNDVPQDAKDDNFESLTQNLIDMAIVADKATNTADEEEELLALSRVVVPPISKRLAVTHILLKSHLHHSLILADLTMALISTGKGLNAEADAWKHIFVEQGSQAPGAMAASPSPSSSSLL
jgi:hypothetical protein